MSDIMKIELVRLVGDGSNWVTYRDRLNITLRMRRWQDHLTQRSVTQAYLDRGDVNNVKPAMRWEDDDEAVKHLIMNSTPDDIFNRIKGGANAKAWWDSLKNICEGRSRSLLIDLGRKLQNTHCGEEDDVRAHFAKLANTREQLAAMGETVADQQYANILLASLPSCYEMRVCAITTNADETGKDIDPARIIKHISDDYDKRMLGKSNGKTAEDQAFTASTQQNKRDRRNIECFNCKKKGHMKADCWAKGGGKEGQRPTRNRRDDKDKSKDKDSAATATENNEDIESWAVIVADSEEDPRERDEESWSFVDEDCSTDEDIIEALTEDSEDEVASASSDIEAELYDSGASRHISPFRHRFLTYRPINPRPITAADKRIFYAIGSGDLQIQVPNGASTTPIVLRDALHAPDIGVTVVSIGRIAKAGYRVLFRDDRCQIQNKNEKVIGDIPVSTNGIYKVLHAGAATLEQVDLLTLHRRLGHVSVNAIRTLIRNNVVAGLQLLDDASPFFCESCEYAKTTRKPINKERQAEQANNFGDEIHTDLWGPSPIATIGGRIYYVTFTDDFSRYTSLELLKSKDQTLQAYKTFAAWAETQHNVKIRRLRSDRGGEYTGGEFTKFLQEQGTERRLTTHDTPQHNGVAESLNRRLLERVRAMMHHAQLSKSLWGEAIMFAVWLKNRTSTRALGNVTPFERLYGKKPDLSRVPEWGQHVWVHNDQGSKLDARATEGRWVGFDKESTHAHRIYWPDKRRISVERNIKFVPTMATVYSPWSSTPPIAPQPQTASLVPPAATQGQLPMSTTTPAPQTPLPTATDSGEEEMPDKEDEIVTPSTPTPAASPTATSPPAPVSRPTIGSQLKQKTPVQPPGAPKKAKNSPQVEPTRRSQRIANQKSGGEASASASKTTGKSQIFRGYHPDYIEPEGANEAALLAQLEEQIDDDDDDEDNMWDPLNTFDSYDVIASTIQETQSDLKTLHEARSRADWPRWEEAMDREIATLERAGTWTTVLRPPGKNVVGSKWVFRIKRNADGSVEKYKARLVARGFTQIFGEDYYDTFSPVAKLASFQAILALAARSDWDIESFDFNGAYLNGELDEDEEIYMQPPPGYEGQEDTVKRLKKSLYGLKQAGRKWYDVLCRALANLGFRVSQADLGVFHNQVDGHTLILVVHVDDCMFTGSSPKLIAEYKQKFNARYALTDLGPISWLLGIKITRNRDERTISLSQTVLRPQRA